MRATFLAAAVVVMGLPAGAQLNKVPRPAPGLEVVMPDGTKFNTSKYAGKVCVVEFLFTTCPHCQETGKTMSRLNGEYGSKGFQPLGVAFNDNAMMLVPEFVRTFGINYPVGVASREKAVAYLGYNMMSRLMVPQLVFIDRKGVIRYQSSLDASDNLHDERRMRQILEELLKEPAGAAKKSVSMQTR